MEALARTRMNIWNPDEKEWDLDAQVLVTAILPATGWVAITKKPDQSSPTTHRLVSLLSCQVTRGSMIFTVGCLPDGTYAHHLIDFTKLPYVS